MEDLKQKELMSSLLKNITKKGITVEESLRHVDLNSQDEIDLIISISESLNDEIECLKKLLESK